MAATLICGRCALPFSVSPSRAANGAQFCSKRCAALARPAAHAPQVHAKGYRLIHLPDHPRADKGTGYVLEHIVIAEHALGRSLPVGVVVHHADEDPANNAPGNLAILPDNAYHRALHARLRLKKLGANPFTEAWCRTCRQVKPLDAFGISADAWNGRRRECRSCRRVEAIAA